MAAPMSDTLSARLADVGRKLDPPPTSKDALIKLLKQAASCLSELKQSPQIFLKEAMQPCVNAFAKQELLKHQDRDVKVLVGTCISEITRITAPDPPYSDDVLRDIFRLIVTIFSGLDDVNGPLVQRRIILETLATYRSCVVMLDLECDDLVNELFCTFLSSVSDDHPVSVVKSMQKIMVDILDESVDIQENLIFSLFSVLQREKNDVSEAGRHLAMKVIGQSAGKLEKCIKQFLLSAISGDGDAQISHIDYHDVIYGLYQCAPQTLSGIIPYLTGELLADKINVRLKAVNLLGGLFGLSGHAIAEMFRPLFVEFLKRTTDRAVEIRISVIEHAKNCLLSDLSRPEASDIISALSDRLLDYDENVRKQVVSAFYDVACFKEKSIPAGVCRLVSERLRDKSLMVKIYTMEKLADLYHLYSSRYLEGLVSEDDFDWMPGKILRCLFDEDFRSETIEAAICGSFSPVENKVKQWIVVFSTFDKADIKSLEKLLMQKNRLQLEMQKYLSFKQTYQDSGSPEGQKRLNGCFRTMSRWFISPAKADHDFEMLHQIKDVNIWKILTALLDPNTSFHKAYASREELLKILGEKHPLSDFLGILSMKCAFLLFNKEFVKRILFEIGAQRSAGNTKFIVSSMNLLVVIAKYSPLFFSGAEEDLVQLLKEDDDIIKEGIVHVLANAGGIIREQLSKTSSSVDLLLERLCLEGSRKQAKYSVQALGAITKDDGLKSLSVLYKKLVDLLNEHSNLPAILQSLGCIAQSAMSVFETREDEIVHFITAKVFEFNSVAENDQKDNWDECSEVCRLKIYSIKTLVKSYLPVKDSHMRQGIEKLIDTLKNILCFGEISEHIKSRNSDKAHLQLAAAKAILRLSKQWDQKIPVDVFHLTLRMSQDNYHQARKLFLNKVHQYIKERLLDAKYSCAFALNIVGPQPIEFKEDKHNLTEVVQMCQQVRNRQHPTTSDMQHSVNAYPDAILGYLVHVLAHHSSCPDPENCKDVKAYELIYRQLNFFLSVLLHGVVYAKTGVVGSDESLAAIQSILLSIKQSEDAVDKLKSSRLHAVSDIGLVITKIIAGNYANITDKIASYPLPEALYTSFKEPNNLVLEAPAPRSWLSDESAMDYFKSLKLEEKVDDEVAGGEKDLIDDDEDASEIPLGEIIKSLKSPKIKKKKSEMKQPPLEIDQTGNDEDILGMVREINMGNLDKNDGDDKETYGGRKIGVKKFGGKVSAAIERNITKNGLVFSRVKKNNRHLADESWISLKPVDSGKISKKYSRKSDIAGFGERENLASCGPHIKSAPLKRNKKGSKKSLDDNMDVDDDIAIADTMETLSEDDEKKSRGTSLSMKKQPRKTVTGLIKCSSGISEDWNVELVGCRVKIWWPLDERYYEGLVQSYDSREKKHVVLYDDGDKEILQLDKERWEIISWSGSSKKSPKAASLSRKKLPEEKGSRRRKPASNQNNGSAKRLKTNVGHKGNALSEHHKDDTEDVLHISANRKGDDSDLKVYDSDISDKEGKSQQMRATEANHKLSGLKKSSSEEVTDHSDKEVTGDSGDELLSTWKQRIKK